MAIQWFPGHMTQARKKAEETMEITDVVIGLRVSEEEEREGLDVTMHGERIN